MATKTPTNLSGRQVCAALERVGFVIRRPKGSHIIMRREDPFARVLVPDHRNVRIGTLRRIISDAGLSVEQFTQLLQ